MMNPEIIKNAEQPRQIAVFDFDGTCIDGQSGTLLWHYLFTHGMVSAWNSLRLVSWGLRYLWHLPHGQNTPRELVFSDLSKKSPEEVKRIMRACHDEEILPHYRLGAIAEIKKRKEEGCVVLLVSATFSEIAEVVAEYLGLDGAVATRMQIDDEGNFTGVVEGDVIQGQAKVSAVVDWADEHLGSANWSIAYAYADHHSDRMLLQAAREAFAVCPGKVLKKSAQKRGWQVLDWGRAGRAHSKKELFEKVRRATRDHVQARRQERRERREV